VRQIWVFMRVAFVGYMGSGKSFWASKLAEKTGVNKIDLDSFLEKEYLHDSIVNFVKSKGEIKFRKLEKMALEQVCNTKEDAILAVGGGTPCYYNNAETLNESYFTIYLNVSIKTLVARLKESKAERPLISHLKDDELQEFVAKHLFERRAFYTKAHVTLNENEISLENILAAIPS